MGCDIHLRLEKRLKKDKPFYGTYERIDENGNKYQSREVYYTDKRREWVDCRIVGYDGTWSDRHYGMFAALNDVRNYWDIKHLEDRGFPEDACEKTINEYTYGLWKGSGECPEDWGRYVEKETFERWVNEYHCKVYEIKDYKGEVWERRVQDPDAHSPNWCTTEEMERCINQIFLNQEDERYENEAEEWLALLNAMKGYEATGYYECRAVFWFDN